MIRLAYLSFQFPISEEHRRCDAHAHANHDGDESYEGYEGVRSGRTARQRQDKTRQDKESISFSWLGSRFRFRIGHKVGES